MKEVDALEKKANELIMQNALQDVFEHNLVPKDVQSDIAKIANHELKIIDGKIQTSDGKDLDTWFDSKRRTHRHWMPPSVGAGAGVWHE